MRRFAPLVPHRGLVGRLFLGLVVAAALAFTTLQAQIPGRNVNMVSGVTLPDGDPYLQRQNEPSMAASTRNPLHLLGGSNDYRTVDIPGVCVKAGPGGTCLEYAAETGDAWLGLYKSADGGQRWTSTLLPGYPQEPAGEGLDPQGRKSPLFTGGYKAAADPVVRAGTNGLFYYAGLSFDRGENGKSAIFLARFVDNNNREDRDATAYLGTGLVATASGTDGRFLDKPWMAVDIPRGGNPGTCRIETPGELNVGETQEPPVVQIVPAGTVYVAYTSFFGPSDDRRSEILLTRSFDCGVSWQAPMRVSRAEDPINQGVSIAIDPKNGHVYVAWRRFSRPSTPGTTTPNIDGIMFAKLPAGGRKFNPPGVARRFPKGQKKGLQPERFSTSRTGKEIDQLNEFDQATGEFKFRTNAYPAMAVDGTGRAYLAWSERGFATFRSSSVDGDARIVMATTTDGNTFTAPRAIDNSTTPNDPTVTELVGHQVMPSVAFAGGKIMVAYYDLRETKAKIFGPQITDANLQIRNTIDIRAAMAEPGDSPAFAPSVKVSEYMTGFRNATSPREQLQFNPPNLPMFKQGTVPFMGDYIDLAPAPAFVPTGKGRWAFNTAATAALPTFHAVWTDNRDVRAPTDGDWTKYGPPTSAVSVQACVPGTAGSRNQNIYTSRIAGGLFVGSPGNAKPLSPTVQRGFVVFAQNATTQTRTFRMTILNQPPGGRASFDQFPRSVAPALRTSIDLRVLPRSTASRTVYITSTDPRAQVRVDTSEIAAVGGAEVPGGLEGLVVLNPDIENPDIENPDIENPDIENPDIENVEVYNPDIENPDIENPDIENPDIENPDIENPDIENPDIENPDIENIVIANPDIENPDIENPDIENPDIENPDIENPDIENVAVGGPGVLTDITWNVTNTGNTTSAFNVNLFLANTTLPAGLKTQLILHKTYRTPAVNPTNCLLAYESRTIVVANIPRPEFVRPTDNGVPDQNDPSEKNATLWLGPGEVGKVTLRVYDALKSDNDIIYKEDGTAVSVDPAFNPQTTVTPTISSQGVGTLDKNAGKTDPPLVTPTGANLFFLQMPTDSIEGAVIAPTVAVQVRDNLTGTPVAGAMVTLQLGIPSGATLAGNVSLLTGADGIATFPALAVSAVGNGYTLVATATTGGVPAQAVSTAFNVASAIPPSVVVNTNDSGPGSLRAAMLYANATSGVQTITFDIDGAGPGSPAVITPTAPLPAITAAVVIDGTSQPGWDGKPVVEVRSPTTNMAWIGFGLEASGITIRGLAVTQFGQAIFAMQGLTGHTLEQNYIGTNRSDEARGNGFGVMWRASSSVIRNNVISGNDADGLSLIIGASGNVVTNNRIGLRADGLAALPNGRNGVTLYDAANNNTLEGNLISGNGGVGVDIQKNDNVAVAGTRFRNNTIGLDANGAALANLGGGIRLDTAPDTVIGEPGAGNTISGNQVPPVGEVGGYTGGPGITVLGSTGVENRPVIQANRIGTDPSGNLARPNKFEGVVLVGPAAVGGSSLEGRGNLIAGNGAGNQGTGVAILYAGATGSVIQGNVIGLAANGSALGNGYSGITVYGAAQNALIGGDALGEANTISGNPAAGIAIYGDGNATPQRITIAGNAIYGNVGAGISLAPGANNSQPFPVVSNATNIGSDTMASFNLAGFAPSIYTLRFFASSSCELSGYGEGEVFVGKTAVDTSVSATGSILLPLQSGGRVITATATDSAGNTSEFSACTPVSAAGFEVSGTVRYSATAMPGVTVKLIPGGPATNPTSPPLATVVTNGDGTYLFPGVAPGAYWVRVDGPDPSFVGWGANSINVVGGNIILNMQIAKIIALQTPANSTAGVSSQPTLTWTANAEAASYTIQINKTIGWVPVDPGATSATNQYTVVTPLDAGTQHTWQVDAYDGNNRHVGSTVNAFTFTVVASPLATISALLPGSPSGDQMVTFQGTGLTPFLGLPRPKAFFTQGANVTEGFVFFSEAGKWWVRLPGGLAAGSATVYAADPAGVPLTAPFTFTVSATPAAPIITAIVPLNSATAPAGGVACGGGYASLTPTGTATPGQGLGVVAYGTDTMGATVVFTQATGVFEVAADCSTNPTLGLGVTVTVPAGLVPGPVSVSVKQQVGFNTSAPSAPVMMNVPAGTVTAAIGGTGGAPFGPIYCPGGTTAVGFRVATGLNINYALTSAELMCSDTSSTPKFGGGTTPNTALSCGAGERMVGMVGSLAYPYGAVPVVGGLAPRCQPIGGGGITQLVPLPSGFSNAGPIDCPVGQVVKGVQGGEGAVLDRVQLVCGTP